MDGQNVFNVLNLSQIKTEAEATPERKKIFGSFLYQDTNTYFFAPTNYGKTVLGFQIGYHASTGKSFDEGKALVNECAPMKVLYYDAELDPREIYDRNWQILGELNANFLYVNEKASGKPLFGGELLDRLKEIAIQHHAKLIILDNITKILPDLLKADEVIRIIEKMKKIKAQIGCSFLVLGHTTKVNTDVCVQPNSYYGSSHIQNFFQEIFYLDACNDGQYFFLRHAKTKKQETYISQVPVLSRRILPSYGLGFEYLSLRYYTDVKKNDVPHRGNYKKRELPLASFIDEILLLKNNKASLHRIASFVNVSKSAIAKILKESPP